MKQQMVTPKFFTKEIAELAVQKVVSVIESMGDILNRQMCHIVILAPTVKNNRVEISDYRVEPYILYRLSFGDKNQWPRKFDKIALSKAFQLWYGRNDDRTDSMPHLLFSGDTRFWGGVRRNGFVVACSGFQPWFDKMFSGMIADMCVGLSYNGWMTSEDKNKEVSFLS